MLLACYDLLKQIEKRPAMWTGELSLKSINCYVSGYYQALLDKQFVTTVHSEEPFFDWIAKVLGYQESTAGWGNMILAYSMGFDPGEIVWEKVLDGPVTKEQHQESIRLFYELLEQYKIETAEQNQNKS